MRNIASNQGSQEMLQPNTAEEDDESSGLPTLATTAIPIKKRPVPPPSPPPAPVCTSVSLEHAASGSSPVVKQETVEPEAPVGSQKVLNLDLNVPDPAATTATWDHALRPVVACVGSPWKLGPVGRTSPDVTLDLHLKPPGRPEWNCVGPHYLSLSLFDQNSVGVGAATSEKLQVTAAATTVKSEPMESPSLPVTSETISKSVLTMKTAALAAVKNEKPDDIMGPTMGLDIKNAAQDPPSSFPLGGDPSCLDPEEPSPPPTDRTSEEAGTDMATDPMSEGVTTDMKSAEGGDGQQSPSHNESCRSSDGDCHNPVPVSPAMAAKVESGDSDTKASSSDLAISTGAKLAATGERSEVINSDSNVRSEKSKKMDPIQRPMQVGPSSAVAASRSWRGRHASGNRNERWERLIRSEGDSGDASDRPFFYGRRPEFPHGESRSDLDQGHYRNNRSYRPRNVPEEWEEPPVPPFTLRRRAPDYAGLPGPSFRDSGSHGSRFLWEEGQELQEDMLPPSQPMHSQRFQRGAPLRRWSLEHIYQSDNCSHRPFFVRHDEHRPPPPPSFGSRHRPRKFRRFDPAVGPPPPEPVDLGDDGIMEHMHYPRMHGIATEDEGEHARRRFDGRRPPVDDPVHDRLPPDFAPHTRKPHAPFRWHKSRRY